MIVAVDWQKLAWLLNENCSSSIICDSFSSSSTTQDSFIWKYFSFIGGNNSGKRRIMKKAEIKSHKRACQTGNCGSVLVCNVDKGTPELKKENTGNFLHQILQVVCFSGLIHGELCGCWEQIFVAHNKVVFSASYMYSKSGLVNKLKLFSRMSTTTAKISLRNEGTLLFQYMYV